MNSIQQLQVDNLDANQRLHKTQDAIIEFKKWFTSNHETYAFEGMLMLNAIISGSYPLCDTIIEDVPITNLSGVTCACEQSKI